MSDTKIKSAESTDWTHPSPFQDTDWTKEDNARLDRGRERVTYTDTVEHLDPFVAELAERVQCSKAQEIEAEAQSKGQEAEAPQSLDQPVEAPQSLDQSVEVAQSESQQQMQAEHSTDPEVAEALARIQAARAQEQALSNELER